MKLTIPHSLALLFQLCTVAYTATIPAPNRMSIITLNNTLGSNTTLLSLASGGGGPSDLPEPYSFRPQLPPGHGSPSLTIQIQGYSAADMDPQALINSFNKARVDAEYDHDPRAKITEKRLVYRTFNPRTRDSVVVAFTPRQGVTTWEDWDEAATGFYHFFLDRAVDQKDGFGFIFELIADGIDDTIGFGTVTGKVHSTAAA